MTRWGTLSRDCFVHCSDLLYGVFVSCFCTCMIFTAVKLQLLSCQNNDTWVLYQLFYFDFI